MTSRSLSGTSQDSLRSFWGIENTIIHERGVKKQEKESRESLSGPLRDLKIAARKV